MNFKYKPDLTPCVNMCSSGKVELINDSSNKILISGGEGEENSGSFESD